MTTSSGAHDDRVLFDVDPNHRIATITLNNPKQRNSYDAVMRDSLARCLDRVAEDDDLTVALLRGAEGVFSTGADMNNAYGWYGEPPAPGAQGQAGDENRPAKSRPSQRRRLAVDRKSFSLFFHRLGPVLARRLLLTGDVIEAGEVEHLGIFTETCVPAAVTARAWYWAEKAARMPADGVVIAKEAFRLVEQSQAYQGEEVASYLFHAFGTNLQFAPGEFNFVKTRAQHGTKEAFRLRDEHFHVSEPETR
jgi:enoyl-CoA hydratase